MYRVGSVILLIAFCAAVDAAEVRLTGQVVDPLTGRPVPCRLYVEGPPGTFHLVRSASTEGSAVSYEKRRGRSVEIHTTISGHPFFAELPEGEYKLTAERGKEYHPATRTIQLQGAPVEVKLELKRWIDMRGRGWYSGDTHVHRSLDDLRNIVKAEDLNVSFPLVYWITRAFESPEMGDRSVRSQVPTDEIRLDTSHAIWPRNTEYEIFTVKGQRHTLGAFFVIGHRGTFERGVPPVAPIAEEARRQGALLELDKHAWPWSIALVPLMNVDLFELANNHIWRTEFGFAGWGEPAAPYMKIDSDADGWTERGWIDYGFQSYYALLNCGFRLRPTAGTASGVHPVPLGYGRVYVRLNGELTAGSWLRALNEGRSFVTTGPMLFVEVNGKGAGEHFQIDEPATFRVTATTLSGSPIQDLELVRNGEVVKTWQGENDPASGGAYRNEIRAENMERETGIEPATFSLGS